jgi:polar amino acid transport system permease protein
MTLETMLLVLSKGFLLTFAIFGLTLLGSLPLGLLVAFGRMSKIKPIQWIIKIYISIMRGTPLMLQLMVVFYGPSLLLHLQIGRSWRFTAAIVAFVLNYAAYFAEIYRAGIEATPVGQYEAAAVLGYTKAQTFFKIVLPQVIKRILPPVTNEVITLVKDTSLASVIAIMEMFTWAEKISTSQKTMMPFVISAVFYYVFNYVVAFAMERCEKSLDYYR